MLKIALAQINPTIADIDGNVRLMLEAAESAHAQGAEMVVFPELSLCAYYPADLLEDPIFMERVENGLQHVLAHSRKTPDLYWVIGAPTKRVGRGKPLHNSLLVIYRGEVVLQYHKQLLPTYNIFDERRHFEPGPSGPKVLRVGDDGARVGFMICEDGWNDSLKDYESNPYEQLAAASPDLVISINASPSNRGRKRLRHEVFGKASARHSLPLIYVNQVGGHDQLVYDGASFVMDPQRGVVFEAASFEPQVTTIAFDTRAQRFCNEHGDFLEPVRADEMSVCEFYRRQIVLGLRDYARRCGFKAAVVGSSGGIDSALTIALAVEALDAENVVAITMPSKYSSDGSVSDSQRLCENLNLTLLTHPIEPIVHGFTEQFEASMAHPLTGLARENLQARIRGTILMEYSNQFGHLLLTTGNKSEISVGYCTLYGDTNGGLGLIGDLYKTEVFALCRHLNESAGREIIPNTIIDKPPSAELAPDQRDTDSLPPYEVLDEVLKILIEGSRLSPEETIEAKRKFDELASTSDGNQLIDRVRRMIVRNEYKRRQAPPILRVRARAFGSGRQMPIAAKY